LGAAGVFDAEGTLSSLSRFDDVFSHS
jgi:hypothetical protein